MSDEHPTVGEIDRRRSKASPVHRGMDLRWIHMQRFACFACRKAFKQPGSQETWPPSAETRPFPCPDCGDVMIKMGRDFEVPRRNNKQAWLTVGCFGRSGLILSRGGSVRGRGRGVFEKQSSSWWRRGMTPRW